MTKCGGAPACCREPQARYCSEAGLMSVMGIATGRQVERGNEVVLYRLSQPCDLLVFILHNLYMLSKLEEEELIIRLQR